MSSVTSHAISNIAHKINAALVLKAPQPSEIKFFNEPPPPPPPSEPYPPTPTTASIHSSLSTKLKANKKKKTVHFPENIIKDYSDPPKLGWVPGSFPTSDLVDAYLNSCDRHKCKPIQKLVQQLKALQDLDCSNGEKVNYLNLKNERIDSKQIETLEEIFKRLSFKTIDFEHTAFEDEACASTLFEILGYYDTVEKLILANCKTTINLFGWQEISKFVRKGACLEYLDIRGHTFNELIYFTYLARSIKLTTTLRVVHLEQSNISGRYLLMLAAALKDNQQIKELFLGDNKIQAVDANSISTIIKENDCLEILDLRNNNIQDIGLSHVCSGLSEQNSENKGLRSLVLTNNNITAHGVSYLSKALIHNRSLKILNISNNSLTNEAVYELKEALIVNKQITSLFLVKTKLSDEGVIALAEYIAETGSLSRLDLRDNDIRLGGLMALVSSLKFNNTLSRLDVDREPRKEHNFFHMPFQLKDSMETSKRLLQDLAEYCLRNQRAQAVIEADRAYHAAELAKKQAAEREITLQENDKQLTELLNELNSVDQPAAHDMDEMLDEVLANTTSDKADQGSQRFGQIDQFNNTHGALQLSDSYQLIDGVDEESSETDADMVIVKTTIKENTDKKSLKVTESSSDENASGISQKELELEVLSTANALIEKVVLNLKKLEVENVQLFHQNSSDLLFEPTESQLHSQRRNVDREDASTMSLYNFNDSNDLSVSIEQENSQNMHDESKTTVRPIFVIDSSDESKNATNESSLLNDVSSCNDSDIEVISVHTKFVNNLISKSVKINEDRTDPNSTSTSEDRLDSLTEKQVRALIDPDTIINPLFIKDSSVELNKISTPIRPTKKTTQNDEQMISSSDTSLILSSSPFNEFFPKLYSSTTTMASPESCQKDENNREEDDAAVNKPLFTSEMTNSQISEELSTEIGFEWD